MAISVRIEPISRDVELILSEDLSPAARSARLAEFAREQIAEAAATNRTIFGRTPPYQQFVDGAEGAPLDRVRPDGVIAVNFELIDEVLQFIADELRRVAPVRSGRFRDTFLMLADGDEVVSKERFSDASEIVFTSAQPYARKLEGDDNRAPLSKQAPDGVFEVVAAKAAKRFGNIARIRFGWRSLIGTTALDRWARRTKMKPNRTNKQGSRGFDDWLRRQPSIVVTFR